MSVILRLSLEDASQSESQNRSRASEGTDFFKVKSSSCVPFTSLGILKHALLHLNCLCWFRHSLR